MEYRNIHSDFIDTRIDLLRKSSNWSTKITQTTHEDFIKDTSSHIFTDLVLTSFPKAYLKKFPCSDCNGQSEQRCHGIDESRPLLIKRALEKVYPDITQIVTLKTIIIQFLEEHKTTKFTFKCYNCHKKEPRNAGGIKNEAI